MELTKGSKYGFRIYAKNYDSNFSVQGILNIQETSTEKLNLVNFNSNGGTVDPLTVAYNTNATAPTDPTKTGYTFAGWYSNEALTDLYDFGTPVTKDITLYAK